MAENVPVDLEVTVPLLKPGEKYHAFIAHSSEDSDFSQHITKSLEDLGFKCFHADRDFTLGGTIIANIDHGISKSKRVIVLITESFLKSDWFTFETANTLTKSYERQERVMIPVLHQIHPDKVPSYVKEINYIQTTDDSFWTKLVRAIVESIPITATVPAGNVAHGLAWSYYYGYLSLVLPGLSQRIADSEFAASGIPTFHMMIIILPESCNCPSDFSNVDTNVTHAGCVEFKKTRAGNIERSYKSSMYKIKDPDTQEEFYAITEFATPLLSIHEMEQGAIAGLGPHQKIEQTMLFMEKLIEILVHPCNKECHNKATLLKYKDCETKDGPKDQLSRLVVKRIRHEMEKRKLAESEGISYATY